MTQVSESTFERDKHTRILDGGPTPFDAWVHGAEDGLYLCQPNGDGATTEVFVSRADFDALERLPMAAKSIVNAGQIRAQRTASLTWMVMEDGNWVELDRLQFHNLFVLGRRWFAHGNMTRRCEPWKTRKPVIQRKSNV